MLLGESHIKELTILRDEPRRTIKLEIREIHTGLKIMAGQRTMSGLIEALTGQTLVLPVMLTGHIGWSHS